MPTLRDCQHRQLLYCSCAHLQERLKELTDKFNSELDADRHKFSLLQQEKNEQEMEYEEKLKQVGGYIVISLYRPVHAVHSSLPPTFCPAQQHQCTVIHSDRPSSWLLAMRTI